MKSTINFNSVFFRTIASVILSFLISGVFLIVVSRNPIDVFSGIFSGAFGSQFGISETLIISCPLILCALSVSIANRVGLLSIGAEGQLYLGAIGSVVVLELMGYQNYSSVILLPSMILFAIIFGAIWSGISGYLKAKLEVNETLTTMLMNFIAVLFVQLLINNILKDPETYNWPQSRAIPINAELWHWSTSRLHSGVIIGPVLALVLYFFYNHSKWGLISRVIGSNPRLAKLYHLPKSNYILVMMLLSGAIAGLAGFIQISAIEGRLRFPISLDYGYTGFLVSWLASHKPLLIIPIAIIMAGLITGGDNVQIIQKLPFAFVKILQGILFITFLLVQFSSNKK